MEVIELVDSDDDDGGGSGALPTGLCIRCGPVVKPHACPHGAKVMRDIARSPKRFKTSASSSDAPSPMPAKEGEEEEETAGDAPTAHPLTPVLAQQPDIAFGLLKSLMDEHSTLQSQQSQQSSVISQQQQDLSKTQQILATVQKAEKDACSEITRLQSELTKRDKTIADQDKKLKVKPKGKAAMAAAAAAASGLATAKVAYVSLMDQVGTAYMTKAGKLQAAVPPPAPAPAPAPAPPPAANCIRIIQQNSDPRFNTVRDLIYLDATAAGAVSPQTQIGWHFDNTTPPTPWQPTWTQITDSAVTALLDTLGAFGAFGSFTPTVGNSVQYTFGQHTYDVRVRSCQAPQAPVAPPPPPPPPVSWKHDMLFNGKFYEFSTGILTHMLSAYDFDGPDQTIKKSAEVALLAEMFSSYAQGFEYDPNKCELWLKPNWLKMWLRTAKERKYNECRLLMHGMKTQNYHLLAKDLSGFDFNFSQHGVKRWGFYAACSDHIASDYNAQNGGSMPDGSAVIGLLLIKRNAGQGAYEHYNLFSHRAASLSSSVKNAYAVRDQMLWLPLGLAYAKKP